MGTNKMQETMHADASKKLISVNQSTDWFSVIVLTLAAIMFVTAELLPVGILPEIGRSFQQPIGKVGLIVTAYAWTVGASAVLITMWCGAIERRTLLLFMIALFAVANLLVAFSPTLLILFIARIIGAFSHGVFWSIVGPLCIRLSGPSSKARATAIVFGGIAIATVVAVPAGTVLAHWLGWRFAFGAIAVVSLFITIAVIFRFPKLHSESKFELSQLFQLIRYPLLRRIFTATVLALTGHFCAFTYISLLLEKGIGIESGHLAFYLFLFGGAGLFASIFAGKLADHHLRRTCQSTMAIMAMVIIFLACLPLGTSIMAALLVIIWGAGICILTITLQSLVLILPVHLTDMASAIYVSMFNIGIGSGAFLGGLLADHFLLSTVAWVGGAILLLAAVIVGLPIKAAQDIQSENL